MKRPRVVLIAALGMSVVLSAALVIRHEVADSSACRARGAAQSDFNGDGCSDLVIPLPERRVGNAPRAGAVKIVYGSGRGLRWTEHQLFTQDSPGMADRAEGAVGYEGGAAIVGGDRFAASMATGDFDANGYDDLAVGIPDEHGEDLGLGAVAVLYGSSEGLQTTSPDDQFWTQDTDGVKDSAEPSDEFGGTLSAGDFNGDGFDDLAIGSPWEIIAARYLPEGAVNILYGSTAGLQTTSPDDQFWTREERPSYRYEEYDLAGRALVAGDFDADGFDELVVGVGDMIDPDDQAGIRGPRWGEVRVLPGSRHRLRTGPRHAQHWSPDSLALSDLAGRRAFSTSMAAADFNGDGFGDVAVGLADVYREGVLHLDDVIVLYGSRSGLQAHSPEHELLSGERLRFGRGETDVDSHAELGSLMVGDFDADGYFDLVVGRPQRLVSKRGSPSVPHPPMVHLWYGSASGLDATGRPGGASTFPGVPQGTGDYDGDGYDDLVLRDGTVLPGSDVGLRLP